MQGYPRGGPETAHTLDGDKEDEGSNPAVAASAIAFKPSSAYKG